MAKPPYNGGVSNPKFPMMSMNIKKLKLIMPFNLFEQKC
jgi:hypothetical protein